MKTIDCYVSKAVRRNIKRQEDDLDRKCRRVWSFTNPKGQKYLFGSFCKNYDRLIVTVAYWRDNIGFLSSY